MTNTQILIKAIKKAKNNGYTIKWWDLEEAINAPRITVFELGNVFRGEELGEDKDRNTTWFSYYEIIFSHSFAKAYWQQTDECIWMCPKHNNCSSDSKIKCYVGNCHGIDYVLKWQYHLQQMVLEENPLKYLEKFLDE